MSRLELQMGRWVVRRRWWVIFLTLVVVIAAGSGIRHLTFNDDLRVFFSKENPHLQALENLESTYAKSENVIFVIAPQNGNVFERQPLTAVERLTDLAWKIPHSTRVDSITNFQHTWSEGDDLFVENLVGNAQALSDGAIEQIREIALSEPLLANRLISPTGHVTGINVTILLSGESPDEVLEIAAHSRSLSAEFRRLYPQIDIYLTGAVMFDNGFSEVSRDDLFTLVPIMFVMLIGIAGLALRSFSGTLATVSVILISTVTAMGLAGWLRFTLNPASANAPTIILTLAVADSIHVLATMFKQMRLGRSKPEAIAEAVRDNLRPVFLTSATTAIGFLTMNFSDAPPFRDLGNIVALGVMAAFIHSVLFLPALMAVLPVGIKRRAGEEDCPSCNTIANFVLHRFRPVFWATLALALAFTSGIHRIELNDDWVRYFDDRYDIRQATDFMARHLTGTDLIEYSLSSGEPGGINEPAYLAHVEKFAQWYRSQPKVMHVNTVTDILKRLNRNMHGDHDIYARIPERRDLAAQYLLLYELSLPYGLDLNNQINVDRSATRMIVTLGEMTTRELRELDERAAQWLRANTPETMWTHGSGLSVIWAHISHRNIRSMLGASFGALIVISGLLIVAFQSLKLGLLSLIPNLMPAVMAFGVWGLLVGQVGLGLSVIVSLTIGIVVDDTVHFLTRYIDARRHAGMTPAAAVRYAFNTVGTALWVTSAALVAGFLVLTFSGYRINSDMGVMTAMTISLALALDFLFLPALLIMSDGRKRGHRVAPQGGLAPGQDMVR